MGLYYVIFLNKHIMSNYKLHRWAVNVKSPPPKNVQMNWYWTEFSIYLYVQLSVNHIFTVLSVLWIDAQYQVRFAVVPENWL